MIEANLYPEQLRTFLGRGTALALASEKWSRSGLARSDEGYRRRLKGMPRRCSSEPAIQYCSRPADLRSSVRGMRTIRRLRSPLRSGRIAQETVLRLFPEGLAALMRPRCSLLARRVAKSSVFWPTGLLAAVRNRQNRIGIEARRLVLISPYHPEAGFNAGNAMSRNSSIYCLAGRTGSVVPRPAAAEATR